MGKKIWIWNHYATVMFKNKNARHYNFAKYLSKMDYEPVIFCANTFHNTAEEIEIDNSNHTIKYQNNIPFVFVKTKSAIGNGLDRLLNMLIFFFNLFSVSKKIGNKYGKPDTILASSVHPLTLVAGILVGRRMKVPVVCEIRDLWPEALFYMGKVKQDGFFGRLLSRGEYWIYKNADALIFTKEGDVDHIIESKWNLENGGEIDLSKVHYINNGVDVERFNNSISNYQIDDKDLLTKSFKIIYAGTIRPVNNVDTILETAKLLSEHNDIEFLIYGEGNQKIKLEKKKSQEKIENVKFKGYIDKKYIPYVLSQSSINVLNYSQDKYNWERGNSSNKLFEYMASGTPIISTVKMGYSLIKRYDIGIELKQNTPEALAEAIITIKNLPQEEYNNISNNAQFAANDFDFNKLTNKLINVIETL